jgi:GDP-mannose 6-dehydrogenase
VESTRIAVFGLGYVGCVTGACLARLDHSVIGVDSDPYKVSRIQSGLAPFYEPGLDDIVREAVRTGHLSACVSADEALSTAEIAMICVGTPSERNGDLGLGQLQRVLNDVASCLERRNRPLIVAIRSTVFPGTCEHVVLPAFSRHPGVSVVSNPEFLRQGCALHDFMEPPLIVAGALDREPARRVADLYSALDVKPYLVSLRSAEMIKYACNAFHAVKIAFSNEIGALCEQVEVDSQALMELLCQDRKLNISPAYLKPGFAFGGSCLAKDLRALTYRGLRLDLKLPLLESVIASNAIHLDRAVVSVLDLTGRIGVFGLAFKKNTDDLRESPVVALLERLIGKGRDVRVYDPHIRMDSIYGTNREFVLKTIPHIGALLEADLGKFLSWADHLVVTQKPDATIARCIAESNRPVLDVTAGS